MLSADLSVGLPTTTAAYRNQLSFDEEGNFDTLEDIG